jgi:hypothetical protein
VLELGGRIAYRGAFCLQAAVSQGVGPFDVLPFRSVLSR